MAIYTLNHDRAKAMGVEVNSYASIPPECFDITYAGAVLDVFERNYHDDSDFYAIVWDDAAKRIREIQYATTRFWTYRDGAAVDATPETIAAATAYCKAQVRAKRIANAVAARQLPHKGAIVEVVKGRKVAKGLTGTVLTVSRKINAWTGKDEYFALFTHVRGADSVKAEYLKVITPADDMPTAESAAKEFDAMPYQPNWYGIVMGYY